MMNVHLKKTVAVTMVAVMLMGGASGVLAFDSPNQAHSKYVSPCGEGQGMAIKATEAKDREILASDTARDTVAKTADAAKACVDLVNKIPTGITFGFVTGGLGALVDGIINALISGVCRTIANVVMGAVRLADPFGIIMNGGTVVNVDRVITDVGTRAVGSVTNGVNISSLGRTPHPSVSNTPGNIPGLNPNDLTSIISNGSAPTSAPTSGNPQGAITGVTIPGVTPAPAPTPSPSPLTVPPGPTNSFPAQQAPLRPAPQPQQPSKLDRALEAINPFK